MGFRRVLRYKQSRPAAVVTVEPPATDFGMYRPHWQGYGTDTVGGRGPGDVTPTIVVVNTLEDNNDALGDSTRDGVAVKTGSFRSACALDAPRFVTFEVSGTIDTTSLGSIMIEHSYITIAGQTAPAGTGGNPGGINIKGKGIHIRNCSHVVLQHLRIRLGRYLDKLIDELAKGKAMEKILRQ